jgi:hypothetical protein
MLQKHGVEVICCGSVLSKTCFAVVVSRDTAETLLQLWSDGEERRRGEKRGKEGKEVKVVVLGRCACAYNNC